jgi:hypothetical protein
MDAATVTACARCSQPRVRLSYCEKHLRFRQMRSDSQKRGKAIPTPEQLETLVPIDMRCPICVRPMHWNGVPRSQVISIQHDRNGDFRLICFSCNRKHADMPGDSFYDVPKGSRYCYACKAVKPESDFYQSRKTPGQFYTGCKACNAVKNAAWERANREHRREYRSSRKVD